MPISKIGSKGIKDAELSADDIAPGTITNAKIADSTIANAKLAGSIANDKLANSTTTINGTAIALGASGTIVAGTDWQSIVTSDTTMVSSRGYFVNTAGGAITMTLPASPSLGDFVEIIDMGSATTNNITVARNGSNIAGNAADVTINANRENAQFTYADASTGWARTNNDAGSIPAFVAATGGTESTSGNYKIHVFNSSSNFVVSDAGNADGANTVQYLVVAGGGGSGREDSGGGGAGGYRTNNPSPDTGGLSISATTYPITVGGGGAGGTGATSDAAAVGNDGSNSVFHSITSTGGGGGGAGECSTNNGRRAGRPGGSGGGGAGVYSPQPMPVAGGSGNTPPVSPSQGNPGGNGPSSNKQSNPSHYESAGGGGGASAAGGNGSPTGGAAGAGGAGSPNSITGSNVTYAGGGAGGHHNFPSPAQGGAGGGGNAGYNPGNRPGSNGTANLGGGGGGDGGNGGGTAGSGGSGIVVIKYKFQAS